jgi:hypothetical protein
VITIRNDISESPPSKRAGERTHDPSVVTRPSTKACEAGESWMTEGGPGGATSASAGGYMPVEIDVGLAAGWQQLGVDDRREVRKSQKVVTK